MLQVVRLTDEQRLLLARLVVALADRAAHPPGDDVAVADAAVRMGFRTRHMHPQVLVQLVSFFFDRDAPPARGLPCGPAAALRALHEQDHILCIPQNFILAARVSLLMRGTAQILAQERMSIATEWRREAEETVRSLSHLHITT